MCLKLFRMRNRLILAGTLLSLSLLGPVTADVAGPKLLPPDQVKPEELATLQANYKGTITTLGAKREELALAYRSAEGGDRSAILEKARALLLEAFAGDLAPAWYGTEWDFNGVTQVPGEGQIACGYFVTTLLRDMGFDLQRVKLAQQPSQTIIRTTADTDSIKVIYDRPVSEFQAHIQQEGPGLYVVGLDRHTGFVLHDGEKVWFVHSSYYRPPFSVTAEPLEGQNPLAHSKYRVVGKILGNEMVRKWLKGESFPMKT